jgi:hypothetical protein
MHSAERMEWIVFRNCSYSTGRTRAAIGAKTDEDGSVNYGVNEEDPGGMTPGSLVVWSSVGLGDGLEAALLQTK